MKILVTRPPPEQRPSLRISDFDPGGGARTNGRAHALKRPCVADGSISGIQPHTNIVGAKMATVNPTALGAFPYGYVSCLRRQRGPMRSAAVATKISRRKKSSPVKKHNIAATKRPATVTEALNS